MKTKGLWRVCVVVDTSAAMRANEIQQRVSHRCNLVVMMYLSSSLLYPSPETAPVKYSELLALDQIEAMHAKYDYTSLNVFIPLKAYLEQNLRWIYDGNGRWSTSDRMVRLRSDGDRFHLEVWVISGHVHRIHQFGFDDTAVLLRQLRSVGV